MSKYDSLRKDNQFSFVCPLFDVKSRMGACVSLREKVYAGQSPTVRPGCQAAMRCNKCPAAAMIDLYSYSKSWNNDHHGSLQPKDGKLHALVLDRVARPLLQDKIVNRFPLSDTERMLLAGADDRIAAQLKTAPGELIERTEFSPRKRTSKPAPAANSNRNEAARTGDMSAALNAA